MSKTALISVSDRTGLASFARRLVETGYQIIATSGTVKFLTAEGIPVIPIELYTGQREILGGRVKTLHPKIHGGILAKRDDAEHVKQLGEEQIAAIDIVAVNLYPFVNQVQSGGERPVSEMVELVDVGGPTMIRAAAKNFRFVVPIIDPADYEEIGQFLSSSSKNTEVPLDVRRRLATKVFTTLAHDALTIATYFSRVSFADDERGVVSSDDFPEVHGMVLEREQALRYGENPHQKAALYRKFGVPQRKWKQLQGKELSYNNLLDFDAAIRLQQSLPADRPFVGILKHHNPCGVASGENLAAAIERAKLCDPRSHFGGVLVCTQKVDVACAQSITEDFAEIVVAPGYDIAALDIFARKKNLRVLELEERVSEVEEMRSAAGGLLIQSPDGWRSAAGEAELMTSRSLSDRELRDLNLAWAICANVKSNAVVIVNQEMLIGCGAGQMSRIDSTELAISKAARHGHSMQGAVAASDAFFPFADSIEILAKLGVCAVIAPRGSRADAEVAAAADKLGISLMFVSDRHFRH